MHAQVRTVLLLLVCLTILMPSDAQAWRRRRSQNYGTGGGLLRVAPKAEQNARDCQTLQVSYDYDSAKTMEVAYADRVRVFLLVSDPQVLESPEPVVAEVRIADLRDSETFHIQYVPVSLDHSTETQKEYASAHFDITNSEGEDAIIQPARVYRMFVNLHRKAKRYDETTVIGRISRPYYVATSGESVLDQARQQIAMRTFREWYYTERGWRSDEPYRMDCHAYYLWATSQHTVGASYNQANLGRLFGGRTPYRNGSEIAGISETEPIHGDYVRIPGHTFMLLAYDPERRWVWTMEGNFGASIEIALRSASSGWTVGHLAEEHIDVARLRPRTDAQQDGDPLVIHRRSNDSQQEIGLP